ncbi:MAG: hypothetical protein AAB919_00315 [Patescibacteria group bacterium]
MDVRTALFLVLLVVFMLAVGTLGYVFTGGNMKFVAGYLNYMALPFAIIIAGWIAFVLPCECRPAHCTAE